MLTRNLCLICYHAHLDDPDGPCRCGCSVTVLGYVWEDLVRWMRGDGTLTLEMAPDGCSIALLESCDRVPEELEVEGVVRVTADSPYDALVKLRALLPDG